MAFEYLSPSQSLVPPASVGIEGLTQWSLRTIIIMVGILAFVFLFVVGFQYVITAKVSEKSHLRQRIQEIIIGLILALLSFSILQFINPKLLSLDAVDNLTPVGAKDPNFDDLTPPDAPGTQRPPEGEDVFPTEDEGVEPNPPQQQPPNPYVPPTQNPTTPTTPDVGDITYTPYT